jgi:CTP:molybdopterin cytidylyltransferase MocA
LLAPFRSTSVIDTVLDAVTGAGFDQVVVVTGAAEIPSTLLDRPGVRIVHNPRWAEGQATSLQAGIAAAGELGADAVVVGLGDQPLVTTECWRQVAAGRTPIVVATYEGQRGNPVRLARSVWPLLPTDGDVGARHVLAQHPELVSEVACGGSSADIDTQEDLDQWN